MPLDPLVEAEMVVALEAAAGRADRGRILRRYHGATGLSIGQLRRRAKALGVGFGYKRRADAGAPRDAAKAQAADAVATLIVKTAGQRPTWAAISTARQLGWIPEDMELATHYVNRHMRRRGIARFEREGPASSRKCRWPPVGQCLQVDVTNCQQWFVPEEGGSIRAAARGEVYRNKPPRAGAPILRYAGADPASGYFRVRYYRTPGESAEVMLRFLYRIFSRSAHPEHIPMCGVPQVLVFDPGPGNKSAALKNLCAELGIEHRMTAAKHPWAKGSVETVMNIWQRAFESELRLWPARSLQDLNDRAERHLAKFCAERRHGRHGKTRAAYYAEHVGEVALPPTWERFVEAATTRREQRTVRAGHLITLGGSEYYVGGLEGLATGDTVQAARAVLDWDEERRPVRIYHGGQQIVEEALTTDARGHYTDERVYRKREDRALEAKAEDRALRLAARLPAVAPHLDLEAVPAVGAPAARKRIVWSAREATYRRDPALLRLVEKLGRPLTAPEAARLGWGERVTESQVRLAVEALAEPDARTGRARAASA